VLNSQNPCREDPGDRSDPEYNHVEFALSLFVEHRLRCDALPPHFSTRICSTEDEGKAPHAVSDARRDTVTAEYFASVSSGPKDKIQ
jgi:hypothetical protein